LSDVNNDLINTYKMVRDCPDQIIDRLKELPVSKEIYYEIRETIPVCEIDQAVRFLYLNRTAFGGMYRVNSKGEFNVPYGGGKEYQIFFGGKIF
jgi:DNA adenine methylase